MAYINLPQLPGGDDEGDTPRGRSLRFMTLLWGGAHAEQVVDGRWLQLEPLSLEDAEAGAICGRTGIFAPASKLVDDGTQGPVAQPWYRPDPDDYEDRDELYP